MWDGSRVLMHQILSLSSNETDPAELDIVMGLPKKPAISENLIISIECLFINALNTVAGMDRNRIDITEIKIETVPQDWRTAILSME